MLPAPRFFFKGDEYSEEMWTAKYCMVARGSSHTNNVRLYDVMVHGCIPVIVRRSCLALQSEYRPGRLQLQSKKAGRNCQSPKRTAGCALSVLSGV